MAKSKRLTERELRETYERTTGNVAIVGANRFGKGGKPSGAYFAYLEDIVRIWYPELSAMMHKEAKREIDSAKKRNMQTRIW